MSRPFHSQIQHQRPRGERAAPPAAYLLILLLALLAAVWVNYPPVASVLPVHPPG